MLQLIIPLNFNENEHDLEKVKMQLLSHPNSSQMICDLQQEIKKTFLSELPDVSGMDVLESLADTVASFNPMNHFNRFLILVIVILVFAVIILLAFKCILTYII